MKNKTIALVFATIGLSSCSSLYNVNSPMEIPTTLNGMVYDYDSVPVQSVMVEADDGSTYAKSDVNGRFTLQGIVPGEHSIRATKEGYETVETKIDYSDAAQIIYIKVISADQLLAQAEKALSRKNWQEADTFLTRAETVRSDNPEAQYLRAVLHFRIGNYEDAAKRLEQSLADGTRDPFVHLFLADLFQYHLNKPDQAIARLEDFLELRYDPDIEKRLGELRKTSGNETLKQSQ